MEGKVSEGPDDSAFYSIDYDVGVGSFGDSDHYTASNNKDVYGAVSISND